jgi:hypothetical protein
MATDVADDAIAAIARPDAEHCCYRPRRIKAMELSPIRWMPARNGANGWSPATGRSQAREIIHGEEAET